MPGWRDSFSISKNTAERFKPALRAAVSCALIVGSAACGTSQLPEARPTPVRVMTARATRLGREARYSANILPATRVDLAFKVGGYVEWIAEMKDANGQPRPIAEGDRVEKNQVLVRVRAGEVTEKLGEVRALASGATAQADAAKQEFERARALFERGAISKSQFDIARAQYRGATAQVEAASAGSKQVRSVISDTTLRAPFDGILLKRLVEVGSLVGPGVPGFIVADTAQVKASFGVPDTMLGALKLGNPISVSIEALPGQTFSGAISRVAPSADPTTRVFEIETTIPNPSGLLKTGMVATVRLGDESPDASEVLLPLSAIVRSPTKREGFAAFVADKVQDRYSAELRELELGEIYGNEVPAKSGLKEGELVVIMGTGLLSPGEPIQIIPDENTIHAAQE